ncbi:serpin B4-like, partial [Daktulosphaira vitifoliae]
EKNDAVKLATGMFVEKSFNIKQSYVEKVLKYLNSSVDELDFKSQPENQRSYINQWVENKTNGKIKNLFPSGSIDKDTSLILASALHFKNNWEDDFNTAVDELFYLAAGQSVTTKMMHLNENLKYYHDSDLELSAIELPYINYDYKMMILLPDAKDGLSKLENNLSKIKLFEISKKMSTYTVDVKMPKFKIEQEYNLVDVLNKLGCSSMFSSNANFSEISDGPIVVNDVLHKAFIDVDEKGTEAAAATGLKIVPMSALIAPNAQFYADHPFIFAIMTRKNDILFMGNLKKPSN